MSIYLEYKPRSFYRTLAALNTAILIEFYAADRDSNGSTYLEMIVIGFDICTASEVNQRSCSHICDNLITQGGTR